MVDYDQILARAVSALDPNTSARRQDLYDRARKTVLERFRSGDPSLRDIDFKSESAALEAAIRRVEAVNSGAPYENRETQWYQPYDRSPLVDSRKQTFLVLGAVAALLVLLASGLTYYYWPDVRASARRMLSPPPAPRVADRDIDNKSYVYMRQIVYYRTNYPVGTLVVDKSRSFLYLVKPQLAAVRYTIDVGQPCHELVGLYHVLRKEEWPGRQAGAQTASDEEMQSPLGARALDLSDDHRIHGGNALLASGKGFPGRCIGLVNDDVIDLYDRTALGSRVVVLSD